MSAGNNVTIVGNATKAPELRFTPSGMATASFGVAVNRRWQNRQTNEWEEAVSFFDVTCWQQLAENVSESVQKGTRVVITGRLDQNTWESKDGEKRSKVEIVADEVGVSLRYATASVVKNERRGPDEKVASGNGAPPAGYQQDEEPF